MKSKTNPSVLGESLRFMYLGQIASLASIAASVLSVVILLIAVFGIIGSIGIGVLGSLGGTGISGLAGLSAISGLGLGLVTVVLGLVTWAISICGIGSAGVTVYALFKCRDNEAFKVPFYMAITYAAVSVIRMMFPDNIVGTLCSLASLVLPILLALNVCKSLGVVMADYEKTEMFRKRLTEVMAIIRGRYIKFGIFMGAGTVVLMISIAVIFSGNMTVFGIFVLGALAVYAAGLYMWVRATLSYMFDVLREGKRTCEAVAVNDGVPVTDTMPTIERVKTETVMDAEITDSVDAAGKE